MTVLTGDRRVRSRTGVLVSTLLAIYVTGVVILFASARLDVVQAGELLVAPAVAGIALLRPEWVILILLAVPHDVLSSVLPRHVTLILLVALFGFLLQRRIYLGPKTGIYPLVGIVALALAFRASVTPAAVVTADGMLKLIVYYIALTLVGFHTIAGGKIDVDTAVNALLVGLVAGGLLQAFSTGLYGGYRGVLETPFRGNFAYLAAMGFGVTYARLSFRRSLGRHQSVGDALLMWSFLCLTVIGWTRAAWMSCLLVFAAVSIWTRRKSFWVVSPLLLVLVLTVPAVGERVLPGGSFDTSAATLSRVTTGRSVLWSALLEQGADALPVGHGWGYTWSLGSRELFGFEGAFGEGGEGYVFPHSDFLYLFVEFGFLGLGLLVAFWIHLVLSVRRLLHSPNEWTRYDVGLLVPVIAVTIFVQLFDNAFALRLVAERFFVVSGLVFGLRYPGGTQRSDFAAARYVATRRATRPLDG